MGKLSVLPVRQGSRTLQSLSCVTSYGDVINCHAVNLNEIIWCAVRPMTCK